MNTKQQGDIGVAKAIYVYTALGYIVSIPNTDNSKYDLIIDKDKQIKRVQVKTTTYQTKYGIYQALLKTSGGNQSWNGEVGKIESSNVDIVFIVCNDGTCYEFPVAELENSSTVNLGKDKDQFKVELDRW